MIVVVSARTLCCQSKELAAMTSRAKPATAKSSAKRIYIDLPRLDGVYVLRRRADSL